MAISIDEQVFSCFEAELASFLAISLNKKY